MKKILFLLGLVLMFPPPTHGCTIPVFRYALEKWDLTPYEMVVFHRGPLPADVQKAVKEWSKAGRANVDFTLVDLNGTVDAKMQKLWDRQKNAAAPWLVVRYPQPKAEAYTVWAGPCTADNVNGLLDSPKRQAILNHLKAGSTVFLLLNSGDEKADKTAYDTALAELQSLEKKIKLPEQSKDGPQMKLPLPLRVSLPLVTLDRNSAEEALFVKLLLATEEDLDQQKGPILFALFGRGRVLGSLYGKELTAEQVRAVTMFLCRECSCQVKELNPGVDMLLAAHWEEIFNKMFEPEKKLVPVPKTKPELAPKGRQQASPGQRPGSGQRPGLTGVPRDVRPEGAQQIAATIVSPLRGLVYCRRLSQGVALG
jgi:hypothetical protein